VLDTVAVSKWLLVEAEHEVTYSDDEEGECSTLRGNRGTAAPCEKNTAVRMGDCEYHASGPFCLSGEAGEAGSKMEDDSSRGYDGDTFDLTEGDSAAAGSYTSLQMSKSSSEMIHCEVDEEGNASVRHPLLPYSALLHDVIYTDWKEYKRTLAASTAADEVDPHLGEMQ
jgi:hypothetical protein